MVPVLEAVPNFSEGRDPSFLREVMDAARRAGVDVLDGSADPDHHRSVVTWVGDPASVEAAALAAADVALARIDLSSHRGVHPRVGALDVLPFVPLLGLTIADAVASAHRVGQRLAERGVPVFFYGHASSPPGRGLAEIRRGGFEALRDGFPSERRPDLAAGRDSAHPTAGVTCVGARPLLLAWNVRVEGIEPATLAALARGLRESAGGFRGLRALGLRLPGSGNLQVSMNLEDVERNRPMPVFEAIETSVAAAGGRIVGTEVVGMMPAALVLDAAARRLELFDADLSRLLPLRLVGHVASRVERDAQAVLSWVEGAGFSVPAEVRAAMERLSGRPGTPGDDG
jgi:glutamate formiminotransferase